jgi:anti-sigma B factor antagonist
MPIAIEDLAGNITKVVLSGRIDIAGASAIDMPMSIVGGTKRAVIVDLSGVEFMASLGLRSVVLSGKAVLSKGGKYVLLAPQPQVEEVITTSGVDELFTIFRDEASAIAAVS